MKENNEIEKGNIVRLKSDNRLMTVNWVQDINGVMTAGCSFFDENYEHQFIEIQPYTLVKVSEKEFKKNRKMETKIKLSKAGATWSDKAAKWASVITAIGIIILGILNFKQDVSIQKINDSIKDKQNTEKNP
jgi:hypothetical protein